MAATLPIVKIKKTVWILLIIFILYFGGLYIYRNHKVTNENRWIREAHKIVIVEEHHEVLKYWFEAAESGIIPKSGNTLFHIDGHSDFAMPDVSAAYPPFFRWPTKGWKDIRYMMQRNDAFIQAAIMSGLFSRIIWVWPSWDIKSPGDHEANYSRYHGETGWFFDNRHNKMKKRFICICMYPFNHNSTNINKDKECMYMDEERAHEEKEKDPSYGLEDSRTCQIERYYTMEEVEEIEALKNLSHGGFFEPNESVLLDVDEDYFGCESVAESQLMNHQIPWNLIRKIDEYLALLICPKSASQEIQADRIFANIILFLVQNCDFSNGKHSTKYSKQCHTTSFLDKLSKSTVKKFEKKRLLCKSKYIKAKTSFRNILKTILKLTKSQVKALIDVGFCMRTSPRTMTFNEMPFFQVCHGSNIPNESMVIFHSSTQKELDDRMHRLDKILSHPGCPKSKLTTVCRSSRDGYTPRGQFKQIEKRLVKLLRTTGAVDKKSAVVYDEQLLGGPRGWPGRHLAILNKIK